MCWMNRRLAASAGYARLIKILHGLRDLGNTILVVEHDPDIMRAADRILIWGRRG